jgi:hypothetical protein
MEKRCGHCKETKDTSEFGKNRSTADGLNSWCKPCVRAWDTSLDRRRYKVAWDKKWRQTPGFKEKWSGFYKSPEEKARAIERTKRQIAKNPDRRKAQDAVYKAVSRGKLPSPKTLTCAHCDGPASQYHHALGYEKENRLMVEPICQSCHDVFRTKYQS